MTLRTKRIIVDILMMIFFILSFEIRWAFFGGNLLFHITVGSVTAVLFFIHVWINRQWLASVGKASRAGKLTKKTNRQYRIDMALIAVWSINILTGLVAMAYSIAGLGLANGFRSIHSLTATLGLVLVIVHIVQHMGQIKSYFRRKRVAQ